MTAPNSCLYIRVKMVHHIAVKYKDTVSIELWKLVTNVNGLHSTNIIKKNVRAKYEN